MSSDGDRPGPHGRSVVGPGRLLRGRGIPSGRVLPSRARFPPRGRRAPRAPSLGTGETLSDVSGEDLAWFSLPRVSGRALLSLLLPALAIGPISIVSPIVSAYAAVTVVCAVVIGGERLGAGETAAILVVLLGVLLASSTSPSSRHANGSRSSGSSWRSSPRSRSARSSTGSPTSVRPTGGSSQSSSPEGFRRSSFSPFRFAAENGASPTARRGFSPRFR